MAPARSYPTNRSSSFRRASYATGASSYGGSSRGPSSYGASQGSSSYASSSRGGASSYAASSRGISEAGGTSIYGGANPGQPLYAFIAICISAVLYAVVWITWVSVGARIFKEQYATYFFMFTLLANIAVVAMIVLDFFYVRYRFNCTSLSVSFAYCGTAGLVLAGLIMLSVHGADIGEAKAGSSLFVGKNVGGIICWTLSVLAVGLQISGHYFYG